MAGAHAARTSSTVMACGRSDLFTKMAKGTWARLSWDSSKPRLNTASGNRSRSAASMKNRVPVVPAK